MRSKEKIRCRKEMIKKKKRAEWTIKGKIKNENK